MDAAHVVRQLSAVAVEDRDAEGPLVVRVVRVRDGLVLGEASGPLPSAWLTEDALRAAVERHEREGGGTVDLWKQDGAGSLGAMRNELRRMRRTLLGVGV